MPVKKLTLEIIRAFFPRKKEGYLSIIVDTNNNDVHLVPIDMEHIDFVCQLIKTTRENLKKSPDMASHLVPALIKIDENHVVKEIISGVSSTEIAGGIKHTAHQLEIAHTIANGFVYNGELEVNLTTNRVLYSYMKK